MISASLLAGSLPWEKERPLTCSLPSSRADVPNLSVIWHVQGHCLISFLLTSIVLHHNLFFVTGGQRGPEADTAARQGGPIRPFGPSVTVQRFGAQLRGGEGM
jgi:hypothetical protein